MWFLLGGRELEDLAFNALAATSSFCDNNHTQKKAFDGDNTTFWYADNNAYPAMVMCGFRFAM